MFCYFWLYMGDVGNGRAFVCSKMSGLCFWCIMFWIIQGTSCDSDGFNKFDCLFKKKKKNLIRMLNNWQLVQCLLFFLIHLFCQYSTWSASAYFLCFVTYFSDYYLVNEWCINGWLSVLLTSRDSLYYWQWYSKH